MTSVKVNASVKYNVLIGEGLISDCGKLICEVISPCKAAVISDDKVFALYGNKVLSSLEKVGFVTKSFVFKNGEENKNLSTYIEALGFLAKEKLSRTDVVIALGGGVVGDLAGFAAATYLRGIRFIQIPTTVLAACDSSVGGKTAVDLEAGKNLAGAFHQPSLVICDTETFNTLDDRQMSCGFAEIIKYGVICDRNLFDALSEGSLSMDGIITRCVEIKRDIVEKDEKESGERKLLNFGHTIGHAIEKHSGFSLTHGEAVAVGMVMITEISEKLGICENVAAKIRKLLKKYDLPESYSINKEELLSYITNDKKVDGSAITLVLPEEVGKCILKKVELSEFEKMLSLIFEV